MDDAPQRRYDDDRRIDSQVRTLQSVRTILEGLILSGVLWLAWGVQDQMKATIRLETQLEGLSKDLSDMRTSLDLPTLSKSLAKIEVELQEHERRISEMEQQRRRQ